MRISTLLSLVVLFFCAWQTSATTILEREGCNGLRASIEDVTLCNNCFVCPECYNPQNWTYNPRQMVTKFDLEREGPTPGEFDVVDSKPGLGLGTTATFENLPQGRYRVKGYYAAYLDGVCYPVVTAPFGYVVGCAGVWVVDETTSVMEVGQPTAAGIVLDFSGTYMNGIFCQIDIQSQGGIALYTTNTYGEDAWAVSICHEDGFGDCTAWTSTYWQEGQVPEVINLLTDVWQLHHEWWFWEGTYTVQLAVAQSGCGDYAWVTTPDPITFDVLGSGVTSGCRIDNTLTGEEDVMLYPNPASQQISIKGLDHILLDEGSLSYQIFDAQGRRATQGNLPVPNYPIGIESLSAGVYILQINLNGQLINKRFSVMH